MTQGKRPPKVRPITRGDGIAARSRYRIRRLIGWRFSGNLSEASRVMGVPYWPLYRAMKQNTVPSLELLEQVATYFGMTFDDLVAPDEEPVKRKLGAVEVTAEA